MDMERNASVERGVENRGPTAGTMELVEVICFAGVGRVTGIIIIQ